MSINVCACEIDGEGLYSEQTRVVFARADSHECQECEAKIKPGEVMLLGRWGNIDGYGGGDGGAVKKCQFCANLFDWFECLHRGGLEEKVNSILDDYTERECRDFFTGDTYEAVHIKFGLSLPLS